MKTDKNAVENIIDFLYQETEIHFLVNPKEKNVMVNATEMAKIFGKRIDNFKNQDSIQKWITRFVERENEKFVHGDSRERIKTSEFVYWDSSKQIEESDVIYTTNKATFMHRKLAIKFAAWLDMDFEMWIIDIIDEILLSQNKKIASVVRETQKLEMKKATIVNRIYLEKNEDAIQIIEIDKRLNALSREKRRANQDMASQYEMSFD